MERCTRGAEFVEKLFSDIMAVLLPPLRRERSRRNTLAWIRTTRSGARNLLVDSVACTVAVRVVGDVRVEEGDFEAAARSRRAMERCTRGAGVVGSVVLRVISRPNSTYSAPDWT